MNTKPAFPSQLVSRRRFLAGSAAGALLLSDPRRVLRAAAPASLRPEGANGDIRLAVVGIGSKDAIGGVGGRGRQLIDSIRKVPGCRIVTLCDVDPNILADHARVLRDAGIAVATCSDPRRVFDDRGVDAVVVATPNHWHALATVWACQAGKDVYVEKPVSHNIWEGRQMVAAARKHARVVQAGTQARSSTALQEAVGWIRGGALGRIRYARIVLYRQRSGIGRTNGPATLPAGIDYDLWCGPAPKEPLKRKQLHYDWHWSWPTGSGEMGNNGVHYVDLCRWAMGIETAAPQVMSLGGRFGFDDDGQTPNTQVALLNFKPAPVYCEIRALPERRDSTRMDSILGTSVGVILQCEGGYFTGAHLSGTAFDNTGKTMRKFGPIPWGEMDTGHMANFIAAVRDRRPEHLRAEILQGHLSSACCHQVNISHRLGRSATAEQIADRGAGDPVLADAIARYREHLRANQVDFHPKESLGPVLDYDTASERFTGSSAKAANALLTRSYRKPFVVPRIT